MMEAPEIGNVMSYKEQMTCEIVLLSELAEMLILTELYNLL